MSKRGQSAGVTMLLPDDPGVAWNRGERAAEDAIASACAWHLLDQQKAHQPYDLARPRRWREAPGGEAAADPFAAILAVCGVVMRNYTPSGRDLDWGETRCPYGVRFKGTDTRPGMRVRLYGAPGSAAQCGVIVKRHDGTARGWLVRADDGTEWFRFACELVAEGAE